jgi:hypothetical protein
MRKPVNRREASGYTGRFPLSGPVLAFIVCTVLAFALPAKASLVLECGFDSLHRKAGTLFHGKCLERKEVVDGKPLPYTEYTFEVIQAVKGCKDGQGKAMKTITIRHVGTTKGRPRKDGLVEAPLRFGLPEYAVGEEVVVFLTRESRLGLCAPVGLSQGKFSVVGKDQKLFVKNPKRGKLFQSVDTSSFQALARDEEKALTSGDDLIELKCFLSLCRKLTVR